MSGAAARGRLRLIELNPHLICVLCGGYLIEATTIIECLHSFCRSCIIRYLESSKYCPICDVQVHKTRPLLNIRPDLILQDLVYKLVPGLYKDEMRRRRDFYSQHTNTAEGPSGARGLEDVAEMDANRGKAFFSADDNVSLCLQYCDRFPTKNSKSNSSSAGKNSCLKKSSLNSNKPTEDCRYLLCPAAMNVGHLKKFLRYKFDLKPDYQIEMFHTADECLKDEYTLMDIAYIYAWKQVKPLQLFYIVVDWPSNSVPIPAPSQTAVTVAIPKTRTYSGKKRGRKRQKKDAQTETDMFGDVDGPTRPKQPLIVKQPIVCEILDSTTDEECGNTCCDASVQAGETAIDMARNELFGEAEPLLITTIPKKECSTMTASPTIVTSSVSGEESNVPRVQGGAFTESTAATASIPVIDICKQEPLEASEETASTVVQSTEISSNAERNGQDGDLVMPQTSSHTDETVISENQLVSVQKESQAIKPLIDEIVEINFHTTNIKQEAPEKLEKGEKSTVPIVLDSDNEDEIVTTNCDPVSEANLKDSENKSVPTTKPVSMCPTSKTVNTNMKTADVNGNIFSNTNISLSSPAPVQHQTSSVSVPCTPDASSIQTNSSSKIGTICSTGYEKSSKDSDNTDITIPEAASIMLSLARGTLAPPPVSSHMQTLPNSMSSTPVSSSSIPVQLPKDEIPTSIANSTASKVSVTKVSAPLKMPLIPKASGLTTGLSNPLMNQASVVECPGTSPSPLSLAPSAYSSDSSIIEPREEPTTTSLSSTSVTVSKSTQGTTTKTSNNSKSAFVTKYFASSTGGRYGQANKSKTGAPTFPSRQSVAFPNLSAFAAKATQQRNNRNSHSSNQPKANGVKRKSNGTTQNVENILSTPNGPVTMKILTNLTTSSSTIETIPTFVPNGTVTTVKNLSNLIATSVGTAGGFIMKAIPLVPVMTADPKARNPNLKPFPGTISLPFVPCTTSGTKTTTQFAIIDAANLISAVPNRQYPQVSLTTTTTTTSKPTSSCVSSSTVADSMAPTSVKAPQSRNMTNPTQPSTKNQSVSSTANTITANSASATSLVFTTIDFEAFENTKGSQKNHNVNTSICNLDSGKAGSKNVLPIVISTSVSRKPSDVAPSVSKPPSKQHPVTSKELENVLNDNIVHMQSTTNIEKTSSPEMQSSKTISLPQKNSTSPDTNLVEASPVAVMSRISERKPPPHIPVPCIPTVHSQHQITTTRNRLILPKSPIIARPQNNYNLTLRLPIQSSKSSEKVASSSGSLTTVTTISSQAGAAGPAASTEAPEEKGKTQALVTPATSVAVASSVVSYDPDVTPIKKLKLMCNGIDSDADKQKEKEQETFLKTFATTPSSPVMTKVRVTNGDGQENKYMHRKHHIMSQHRNAQKAQNGLAQARQQPMSPNPLANGYDQPLELTTKPVQERQKEKLGDHTGSGSFAV